MSPPPYSAKVPLLKCIPDCGTHLKDSLNLISGLSLSPALSKIEVSYLFIGQTFKERLLVAWDWESTLGPQVQLELQ